MRKNICFMANYAKTEFFDSLSNYLEKDCSIFWITVSEKLYQSLSCKYGEDHVLLLGHGDCALGKIDKNGIFFNEIIESDRILRKDKHESKKYLVSAFYKIYEFIYKNKISRIFGEITWGHEILAHRIVNKFKELNCHYLNPHTVRIPEGFFAFFKDEYQSDFFYNNNNKIEFELNAKKPDYLILNDKIIKKESKIIFKFKKIINFLFLRDGERRNPTVDQNRLRKLKDKILIEINKLSYGLLNKNKLDRFLSENFSVYFLHKQPEASIDVIGRYTEDQYQNIYNIWRKLEEGEILLVKEHSNAIGDRGKRFFDKITSLPDVFLIDHREDSHKIIFYSKRVYTVSGTAAYEAALLGKESFTFANCFFNKLAGCRRFSVEDSISFNEEFNKDEFSNWISNKIYPGIISDPYSDPRCMQENNLKNISLAILDII